MNRDEDWVFYRDRPEWKDVTPVPQNDGPYPIVQIAYSDMFKDVFNYLRAVLASEEVSERAFQLSEDAAHANLSNYSVWNYRRFLLKKLNKDLTVELQFCQDVIKSNPKHYQVWHHRQMLVEWLNDASKEKDFTELVLKNDAKNYHAWQHRQWAIRKYELWDGEMEFVDQLLEEDVRNNSAWNQRYFVFSNTTDMGDEVLLEEIRYTLNSISKAPNNESPWNYLRGLLQFKGLTTVDSVTTFTEKLYDFGCRSPHLLGFIIDCIEEQLLNSKADSLPRALQLCCDLALKHDTIRRDYWRFIGRNLQSLYGNEETLQSVQDVLYTN